MPKISFAIIVLNGQPFLEYNLRCLYPFANQIIIVEGAVQAAASIATVDGHSTDGTLQMILDFKRRQDPKNKITLVTAVDEGYINGFWPEKDEMSQAYARRITGDWLWQIDSDEFYREDDLAAISDLLEQSPDISTISFPYYEYFGGFDSIVQGRYQLYEQPLCHRIFKWRTGYKYTTHRPPTVLDEADVDLRSQNWVKRPKIGTRPIYMFHYSYVFPRQARQKVGYYSNVEWTSAFRDNQRWYDESYMLLRKPMFLGERGGLQWLERYKGKHPDIINELRSDLAAARVDEEIRSQADINRLLTSPIYLTQKSLGRLFLMVFWPLRSAWKSIRKIIVAKTKG